MKRIIVAAFLVGAPSLAAELERQPYLQGLHERGVTVVWRGVDSHTARVYFGTDPENLTDFVESQSATQHEVALDGLDTDTEYFYRLESNGESLGNQDVFGFRTAPEIGVSVPFRFWVVGDSGTGNTPQYEVKYAMQDAVGADMPHLFVHVGDMAYNDGTDSEFTDHFFEPYAEVLSSVPVWPALGNHEGRTSFSSSQSGPYFDGYILPTQGENGGLASGTEAYYSFDYANVHFVALDSYHSPKEPGDAMLLWLAADLAATTQDWIVAFWHHPPYTKGTHDSDVESHHIAMRENVVPILEAAGVDLVLGGHSHIYERSFLVDGAYETPTSSSGIVDGGDGDPAYLGPYTKEPGLVANDGALYLVAGHGGASVGGPGGHPLMAFTEIANGSVLVDVHENRLSIQNIRIDGAVTDKATLVKGDAVHIVSPNGGEVLEPGSRQVIKWITVGELGPVDVEYSCDKGEVWNRISSGTENDGALVWDVPTAVSDDMLVRVIAADGSRIGDQSDARFSLWPDQDQTLFLFGSEWSYSDEGVDYFDDWLDLDFDDAEWAQGYGQFGYGEGDERTLLYDAEPDNVPSVYFRKIVDVETVPDETTLSVLYDDGVAVWINGVLVLEENMGNGTEFDAWASATSQDNSVVTQTLGDIGWQAGENIVSVMVKQRNASSSDLSFDMSVTLTTRFATDLEACVDVEVEDTSFVDTESADTETGGVVEEEGCACSTPKNPRSMVWIGLFGLMMLWGRRGNR